MSKQLSKAVKKVFIPKKAQPQHYSVLYKFAAGVITPDEFIEYLEKRGGASIPPVIEKLKKFLATGKAQWSIFGDGNAKLGFLTFSSVAGVDCVGMGSCGDVCYSFKAWRFINAFMRQWQNSQLLRTADGRKQIAQALDKKLASKKVTTIRLYVDGDFANVETVGFWQTQMRKHKTREFYGYSKSLQTLIDYHNLGGTFAPNYRLNLSEGHKYNQTVVEQAKQLPIFRGIFGMVSLHGWSGTIYDADHKTTPQARAEISRRYRALTGKASFACPNRCDTCTPRGHACGSARFNGVDIISAIH